MEVITFVKGNVPSSKSNEFEANYRSLKHLPDGLIASYLLNDSNEPEVYVIECVWESKEALEKRRSEVEIPAAIALFQKVGSKPTTIVYDMIDNLP